LVLSLKKKHFDLRVFSEFFSFFGLKIILAGRHENKENDLLLWS
jgi:hypothetical protein